jgi:hypothetical protein
MPNPNVQQGVLNRLRGSASFTAVPTLNITAPYLGREGISLTFEGQSVVYINTMTGAVTSDEPYLKVAMEAQLLKTQALANAYKVQQELESFLGDCTVRADTLALGVYYLSQMSIENVRALRFNGEDAGYVVSLGGIYQINSALFNL